jgi:hypothetical protein
LCNSFGARFINYPHQIAAPDDNALQNKQFGAPFLRRAGNKRFGNARIIRA